ncbi:hypothetical protein [Aureliella helgolandensis]|uniref:Uncharacterized protein n=1 Tax=Aureliella helgolandensis TaxID=2527968 RepID=A0A518G257_9BACT|nr:hypothetical protein [Aureliella helgolandensis]QDV22681.1 hypothetical protein Q31a_09670 [Aureliella helgolandensis]
MPLEIAGPWHRGDRYVRQCCSIVVMLSCLGSCPLLAEDAEDRTLRAMQQMGLTTSAIEYARTRRDLVATDSNQQAKWTQRIMECYAQAAVREAAQATEYWADSQAEYRKFAQEFPSSPRLPWLKWQLARCDFLHAQSALASFLAAPANTQIREEALGLVRAVARLLEELEEDIKRRLPLAARQNALGGAEAPAEELHELSVDGALLLCEALLIRARLYEANSSDRIAAATMVDAQASDVLSRTEQDWQSRQPLRVAQAASWLDLGRAPEALLVLEELAREAPLETTRTRAATLAIAHLSTHQENSRAQSLLTLLPATDPEFELASLQIEISELQSLPEDRREAAMSQILARAKHIGLQFGDYWRNRADALLLGSVATTENTPASSTALQLMAVEVRQLLAAENLADAQAKLVQYRDIESAAGRGGNAIKIASQAAALYARQGQWARAVQVLQPTTQKFSSEPAAAEAHLLVLASLQRLLQASPADPQLARQYEQGLKEQLELWPDAEATQKPLAWSVLWWAGQQRHAELLQLLTARLTRSADAAVVKETLWLWLEQFGVLAQSEQRLAALDALKTAWDGPVDGSRAPSAAHAVSEVRNATSVNVELTRLFASEIARLSTPEEQQQRLRALAKLSVAELSSDWQQLAIALRLLVAVRSQTLNTVAQIADQWQPLGLPAGIRVVLAPPLVDAIDETPAEQHVEWARQLKLAEDWSSELIHHSNTLTQAIGQRLAGWLQGPSSSLEGLTELTEQAPRDANLQMQLAQALAESGEARWQDSSNIARRVIVGTQAGSPLNYAARWRLIRNLQAGGDADKAREAAQLLLATQRIDDPVWQARFESAAK